MIVGVKFCGNCNPFIETPTLFKKLIAAAPDMEFRLISRTLPKWDVSLLLNACPAGCLKAKEFPNSVVVSGVNVDYWDVDPEDLVARILQAIRSKWAVVQKERSAKNMDV